MRNLKHLLALVLFVLLVLFAIQNMTAIRVNFLGFEFETRRIILMVICTAVGFVLGKVIRLRRLTGG